VVGEAPVGPADLVLNLGAGTGSLTAPLVATGARVLAVELHPGRARALRTRFEDGSITVVQRDLAVFRWPRRPFRVVASPPYALTTKVVRGLLDSDRLRSADLVLQGSAARRFAADPPPGRHARRYRLAVGLRLPRRAFQPPPQVDSAVLRIRRA
jgi:23S rRNA (adenine-N6)-dimethyltransferase